MSPTGYFEKPQAGWQTILATCARFWFARPGRTWAVVGLIAAVAIADVAISLALGGVIGAVAAPAASLSKGRQCQ